MTEKNSRKRAMYERILSLSSFSLSMNKCTQLHEMVLLYQEYCADEVSKVSMGYPLHQPVWKTLE